MAPESEKICEDANSSPAPVESHQPEVDVPNNERTKTTRHPRWTRQETIILIEAKKVVENGGTPVCRFAQSEPKWDLVSSFCQKQGVNRGPVQCRKRWSNLLSDFKKIKKWESGIKDEAESFWMIRNDERREKKLPGFFDGEVYKALGGGACAAAAFPLALIKVTSKEENAGGVAAMGSEQCDEDEEEEEAEAIVDSEKMGWSTEEETIETITTRKKGTDPLKVSRVKETVMTENPKKTHTHPMPSSARHSLPLKSQANHIGSGKRIEIEPMSQEGCKRRRVTPDNCEDTTTFSNPFTKVLRTNSNILKAHLGDQNINCQLARDQQKEQTGNLVAAIGKLTDALIKIAEKL